MTDLQALLLGIIQGLTEYLPVSSSGHLTIVSHLFGVNGEENLAFTVLVHVATVLSTICILWREIWKLLQGTFSRGPLLNDARRYVLCICLLVTAALLTFSYYARPRQKEDISLLDSLLIGVAQAVAVLPGLSRSGSTIATGILLGNKKEKLAQFSFLMVIPPILGEALLDVLKITGGEAEAVVANIPTSALVIGFLGAFVSGCLACKWMIDIVKRGRLVYFGIYCAVVGLLCLVL